MQPIQNASDILLAVIDATPDAIFVNGHAIEQNVTGQLIRPASPIHRHPIATGLVVIS